MKKYNYTRWVLLCLINALAGIGVFAAPPTPADLSVEMLGTNNTFVYTPYVYRARVTNNGGTRSENSKVTIDMPLTDTSPNQFVLGRLSSIDIKCQLVNNKLECDLGQIKPGKRKTVRFTFVMPVSTKTLGFTATTSADVDSNPNNDADTKVLNPRYQDNIISQTVSVLNQHCTGTNLTSFYECELFPSSVTDHETTLNGDGSISFTVGGYTGTWNQPTPKELVFSYSYGNTVLLEFHGYAISANCFDGLSTFPPRPTYVSPYRVCFQ